jgi:formylglycine-generating enzyme required for sulfatase activity
MHGNVWEWVQDCWNGTYVGAPSDGSAWTSGDCYSRIMRGGSWSSSPQNVRSADRLKGEHHGRYDNMGFRVARTL